MSWVATAGGFLLGPIVGALGSRLVTDAAKPKEMTTTLLIGAGVHAACAVGAYAIADRAREENLHAFAYGATWGNGVSAGLLTAGTIYFKTDAGKAALARYQSNTAGDPAPSAPAPAPSLPPGNAYGLYKKCGAPPKGLLSLLTAAKAHGYE